MTNKTDSKLNGWNKSLGVWSSDLNSNGNQLCSHQSLISCLEKVFVVKEIQFYNRDNRNRYLIKDKIGNNLFYGIETNSESVFDKLCICGANRQFVLILYDVNQRPALALHRMFRYDCCGLIPFCQQKMIIKNAIDESMAEVREEFSLFKLKLKLSVAKSAAELRIIGPNCKPTLSCCLDDICFDIIDKSAEDQKCGHICKKSEITSGGHVFEIRFPVDLIPELKTTVICATILIDFYYFEHTFHEHKYHKLVMTSQQPLPMFPTVWYYRDSSSDDQNKPDVQN